MQNLRIVHSSKLNLSVPFAHGQSYQHSPFSMRIRAYIWDKNLTGGCAGGDILPMLVRREGRGAGLGVKLQETYSTGKSIAQSISSVQEAHYCPQTLGSRCFTPNPELQIVKAHLKTQERTHAFPRRLPSKLALSM